MSTRWLTVLLVALVGLAGCAPMDYPVPPEVTLVDLRPLDVSLFEQRMAVELRIRNANDTAMEVTGLRFALDVNGHAFAKGTSDRSVVVPRLADATTEGVAAVATTDLIRQVMDAPEASGLRYRITGTMFLSGHRSLGFEQDGDFTPPAKGN